MVLVIDKIRLRRDGLITAHFIGGGIKVKELRKYGLQEGSKRSEVKFDISELLN